MSVWEPDQQKVLSEVEVLSILVGLRRKAKRSKLTHRSLVIFELSTCYGLRVSEICGLTLSDLHIGFDPYIRIRRDASKSGRARTVPMGWDARALVDVSVWIAHRLTQGATGSDLLLPTKFGNRMHRSSASRMFSRACRCVGRKASIHVGRHTFISHALHRGVDIQAVRAAAGHANLATTSLYSHLVRSKNQITDLFSRPVEAQCPLEMSDQALKSASAA